MPDEIKRIVSAGINKAFSELTERFEKFGFKKGKKRFWFRLKDWSVDFIHIHINGSSYGGPINKSVSFRVHCGNRELNDPFDALALNGPSSDSPEAFSKKYHLRFNAKSESNYERCISDVERFIFEFGEPWYKSNDSKPKINGDLNPENVKLSFRLLGIRGTKI